MTTSSPIVPLLDQTDLWRGPRGSIQQISQMDQVHRYLAAQWLIRRAPKLARDAGVHTARPGAWIRRTPLHQALLDGLDQQTPTLARHWSGCPVRTELAPRSECACHRPFCEKLTQGSGCTCRPREEAL